MKEIKIGAKMKSECKVDSSMTASAVGSGTVGVYATPMMIALMENAALKCLNTFLDDGETSVGISISASHISATPMDMDVWAIAEITGVDRKRVDFKITAFDAAGEIGSAEHSRVVVNSEKFEQRANDKLKLV